MRRLIWLFLGGLIALTALPVLAQDGMFFPQPPLETEVITPENASRLERLGTLGRGTIEEMFWSPDGTKFAVKSSTGIWIYEDLHEEPLFIEGRSAVFAPAWDTLANYSDGGIRIWDLQTRESYGVSQAAGQEVNAFSSIYFNGDGSELVFLVNQPSGFEFWQWDVNQRRLRNSLELGSDWISGLRMNPRGDASLWSC
jgi:WD40 repeat protein